jgi:hypothetical protein
MSLSFPLRARGTLHLNIRGPSRALVATRPVGPSSAPLDRAPPSSRLRVVIDGSEGQCRTTRATPGSDRHRPNGPGGRPRAPISRLPPDVSADRHRSVPSPRKHGWDDRHSAHATEWLNRPLTLLTLVEARPPALRPVRGALGVAVRKYRRQYRIRRPGCGHEGAVAQETDGLSWMRPTALRRTTPRDGEVRGGNRPAGSALGRFAAPESSRPAAGTPRPGPDGPIRVGQVEGASVQQRR